MHYLGTAIPNDEPRPNVRRSRLFLRLKRVNWQMVGWIAVLTAWFVLICWSI